MVSNALVLPKIQIARIATVCFLCAAQLFPAVSWTADSKGQYAVRGAGLVSCELFVESRNTRSDAYLVIAAWADGYVTGTNEYAPETYDLLSFESTELLMAILDEHCRDHPSDPVFGVLNSLFGEIRADRLQEQSAKVTVALGGREARLYVELIRRAQRLLLDQGLYDGPVTGEFTEQTASAIERYQASIDFEPTGFPDQTTLWRLFRSE